MKNTFCTTLLLAFANMALGNTAFAEPVQWKQVVDTPKGLNLPTGLKADILGIELGDTYPDAKAKLEKLLAEGIKQPERSSDPQSRLTDELMGVDLSPPITESKSQISFKEQGGTPIEINFVSGIQMRRDLKGVGPRPTHESVSMELSAPSSGQQVYSIRRSISYSEDDDQISVSDLIRSLSTKFQSEPQMLFDFKYRWQFNDGKSHRPKADGCRHGGVGSSAALAEVNPQGDCDIVLDVEISFGKSKQHASIVTFYLTDLERAKINQTADFQFFESYLAAARTKAAPPPRL